MPGHVHGATSGRMLWISLILTAVFVGCEVFFGLRAHSLALLSDAGHNASDALALGLAAYAVWVARRPATSQNTFGYHRVAILAALANAAALLLVGIGILVEAVQSVRHPARPNGMLMTEVAAVAVLMNTVIAWWLSGDSKRSLNVRAAYVHMLGDAISSVGVLLAGLVVAFAHWPAVDPIVSVMIAGFILYSSWGIVVEATNVLLEATPKGLDVDAMVAAMRSVDCVTDIHDLHVWTVSDGIHFLSCHAVLPETCSMADVSQTVRELNTVVHDRFGIGHATIQVEVDGSDNCTRDPQDLHCAMEPHAHGRVHAHRH